MNNSTGLRYGWLICFGVLFLIGAADGLSTDDYDSISPRNMNPGSIQPLNASLSPDSLWASTFFGGSGQDGYMETPIAFDPDGNVFVASRTSSGLLASPGAYDNALSGTYDVIIAKFTPELSTLLACTYLGGSGDEGEWPGVDLAIDEAGNVTVVLSTSSSDYPTTENAYCDSLTGGWDAAVSRLSNDLTTLLASTYLGGSGNEQFLHLLNMPDGRIVIAGATASADFPTTPGVLYPDYKPGGYFGYDIFLSVFDNSLTVLEASSFFGDHNDDWPEDLLPAPTGGFLLGGWTNSQFFPTTPAAVYSNYRGGLYDGFISQLSADLTLLVSSTFIGGSDWDFVYELGLDSSGNILATGHTASRYNFPTTAGAYDVTFNSPYGADEGDDSYLMKLSGDLTTVLASSFIGGSGWENGKCIFADTAGRIFVAGNTNSTDFPYSFGTFDSTVTPYFKYASDIFVCCFDADIEQLYFGSILGGYFTDNLGSIAADDNGNLYIGGSTKSSNLPMTPLSYDDSFNGGGFDWGGDIFISAFANGYWNDIDDDGFFDFFDNCPYVFNPPQLDTDGDGRGDACACVCGTGGDVNCDGEATPLDVAFLVKFVYLSLDALCAKPDCPYHAGDMNCDSTTSPLDVAYLVKYVYQSQNALCDGCA